MRWVRNGIFTLIVHRARQFYLERLIVPGSHWKVEASYSWLNNFRSLKTCWTKTKEAFIAFLQLGASVVLFRK